MFSRHSSRGAASALLALAIALGAAGCANEEDEAPATRLKSSPANRGVELTIGTPEGSEQVILAEIYSQALEAAGYTVETAGGFGSDEEARQAVESGEISGYPGFSSEVLTAAGADLPTDALDSAAEAQAVLRGDGLVAFEPAPVNRSSALTVPGRLADRFQLEKISDLEGVSQRLRIAASPECAQSPECLPRLEEVYGLRFEETVTTPVEDRYGVLGGDRAELSVVVSTDSTLFVSPLNYPILIDDRRVFPASAPIFIANAEAVSQAGPGFQRTVERVQAHLDREQMQELNSLVLFLGEPPAAVARDYLAEFGYIRE